MCLAEHTREQNSTGGPLQQVSTLESPARQSYDNRQISSRIEMLMPYATVLHFAALLTYGRWAHDGSNTRGRRPERVGCTRQGEGTFPRRRVHVK